MVASARETEEVAWVGLWEACLAQVVTAQERPAVLLVEGEAAVTAAAARVAATEAVAKAP